MGYESSQARTILERTLKKGVALKTIAERSDVSVRTISRLRNGHTVSVVSALSVMNGLGVIWAERKEANLAATESNMRKPVTTHDHASASFEQVEQAALDRGIKADIGLRDTELECAKYRRVMALEAELDAWKLRYERMKASYNAVQSNAEHGNKKMADQHEAILKLGAEIQKKDAWIDNQDAARNQLQKDLQIMSASWKAVSVERDNLEGCVMQRERQLKSCENALIEAQAVRDGLKLERDNLHDQLEKADTAYIVLHKDASYAKYVAWACCIASLLIVLQAAFVAFGGAV